MTDKIDRPMCPLDCNIRHGILTLYQSAVDKEERHLNDGIEVSKYHEGYVDALTEVLGLFVEPVNFFEEENV